MAGSRLILGPGTGLIIAIGALPLGLYLNFGWILAFIGGAVLASTDPVVLREIVRDERIPRPVRQVLKIEAGMNDLVVLPVVLILIAVATDQGGDVAGWAEFLAKLLLLGPAIGFAIGGVGSWLMSRIDAKMAIRQEHQALYGVGLVLASYAAATAAGGDGFLGAFAAGLGVVLLNQSLCDCFLDYGEITSEMAMLLAFVLFGAVLSGMIGITVKSHQRWPCSWPLSYLEQCSPEYGGRCSGAGSGGPSDIRHPPGGFGAGVVQGSDELASSRLRLLVWT